MKSRAQPSAVWLTWVQQQYARSWWIYLPNQKYVYFLFSDQLGYRNKMHHPAELINKNKNIRIFALDTGKSKAEVFQMDRHHSARSGRGFNGARSEGLGSTRWQTSPERMYLQTVGTSKSLDWPWGKSYYDYDAHLLVHCDTHTRSGVEGHYEWAWRRAACCRISLYNTTIHRGLFIVPRT